ncbi:hypothetical protein B0J17DRAFT_770412 [Rhizoctonia solani]|nr:hypothetical protein B0J17DRAFT_770412 [Rhizoctonia solani]
MYIAGLNLPFTESQALNGLAFEEKAGKAVHMPAGKRGEYITAAHAFALFGPTALFLVVVPLNKFVQPNWLAEYALPEVDTSVYNAARVGGSATIWLSGLLVRTSMKHLDAQWNYIGVRERPELVKTGPYRLVRHPMYSAIMLSMGGMVGAFWNWIPVSALGILAVLFAIKMPMEENVMLRHEVIGPEYAAYKRKVPSRVIPYIW